MSWTKTVSGYRKAEVRVGDSLQTIAARELGDARRWYDLANLNNLLPPYITDDPATAGPRVLLVGATLMVPSAAPTPSAVTDRDDVFGTDVALAGGKLEVDEAGDLRTVSGTTNLKQALTHRLVTRPGELLFHPDYGCGVYELIGRKGGAATNKLAAVLVERALRADPRVDRVASAVATISGDSVRVESTAVTVDGKHLPVGVTS
ncbi:GPW/gp25 family protein [Azospirillum sp.]|uniref:GPW/gp25 family protein n=1 Tax=Azospirillum sp. TaxID=34012 RepID=UPI003D73F6D2